MRKLSSIALVSSLAACASPSLNYTIPKEGCTIRGVPCTPEQQAATTARWRGFFWMSENDHSVASGADTCVLKSPPGEPYHNLVAIIERMPGSQPLGFVMAIDGDGTYPGSMFYLNVDGRRFSGEEQIRLDLDLLAVMRNGTAAHFEWSPWPWGGNRRGSAPLKGFGEAYDDCLAFLGGRVRG